MFSLHFHLVLLAHPASTHLIRLPQKFHTSWVTNETKTSSISSKFPQMFPGICKRQSWCWQQKTRIHVLLMRAEGGVRRNGGGPLQWPCWTYEYKREKLPQNEKKGGDITFILSQLFWLPWICLLFLQLLRCVRFFVTISIYCVCGERVIRMQEELRRISLSRILGSCISYLFNIPSLIHQNGFMLDIQYFFKSIFIHFFTQMPGATIRPIFTIYFIYSLASCQNR